MPVRHPVEGTVPPPATDRLPVVDLSRLRAGPDERAAFLAELRRAAREAGFFSVTDHGLPDDVLTGTDAPARRFFSRATGRTR